MTRKVFLVCAVLSSAVAQEISLPNKESSVRFAIIGDNGDGSRGQYEVGEQMAEYHKKFPFKFVIMNGDNMYGGESAKDFEKKFERPYKFLLDVGVKFYASLGNHDNPNQRFYELFNMGGQRYYTFKPRDGVRFFALDSTYMGPEQMQWLQKELAGSGSEWKIAFLHHPLYSSGRRHGPDEELREAIEPLLIKYGVDVVFAGHDHFYERIKPQHGIHHFVQGASGKLRKGNLRKTEQTAFGYDQEQSFMVAEIEGDKLYFQAVTRTGRVVDSGILERRPEKAQTQSTAAGR